MNIITKYIWKKRAKLWLEGWDYVAYFAAEYHLIESLVQDYLNSDLGQLESEYFIRGAKAAMNYYFPAALSPYGAAPSPSPSPSPL